MLIDLKKSSIKYFKIILFYQAVRTTNELE